MTGYSDQQLGPAVVASAATITANGRIFHVSGTTEVTTINPPPFHDGNIYIIPDGAFTTNTGGNIAKASTAVVNKTLIMTWDGTSWTPSY